MARRMWNFLCRASLVVAFVIVFAAVIFNVDLVSYAGRLLGLSQANAAPLHLPKFAINGIDGWSWLVVVLVLIGLSFFRIAPPPPPRQR